jgi:hypothetical protein
MKVIKVDKKVEYRGHRTCSRIRGKIRPKVRFDRRCRKECTSGARRTYTGYTEDIHRKYTGNTQDKQKTNAGMGAGMNAR